MVDDTDLCKWFNPRGSPVNAHAGVLSTQRLLVAGVRLFVAPATHTAEDHREGSTVSICRPVGVSTVNQFAVMSDQVTWLKSDLDLPVAIFVPEIHNAL